MRVFDALEVFLLAARENRSEEAGGLTFRPPDMNDPHSIGTPMKCSDQCHEKRTPAFDPYRAGIDE